MNRSKTGRLGEEQAALALENSGLEIIARNVHSPYGEVDLIAREGETIVFVEVKAWSSFGIDALEDSIGKKKQRRIIATARDFLAKHQEFDGLSIRFDVVFIGYQGITHITSAFWEEM
jgi:putative endonuclease